MASKQMKQGEWKTMKRILLVEDDEQVARVILHYLSQEHDYQIEWAKDAKEAEKMAAGAVDLILLDICLPDVDGVELCAKLRETVYCPIIFVSCLDDESTIIRALETGGDDYITKPFSSKILATRIEANLRRVRLEHEERSVPDSGMMEFGDFRLNCAMHTLERGKNVQHLAPIEYSILLYFIRNANRIISPDELYENIWGTPCFGDLRTVVTHVYNLRKMVDSEQKRHICNVRGSGYCFIP